MGKPASKAKVDKVLAWLEANGCVEDWRTVPGFGQYNTIRVAVFKSGKARLTNHGGLMLTEEQDDGNG